jgi:hypothetical protein
MAVSVCFNFPQKKMTAEIFRNKTDTQLNAAKNTYMWFHWTYTIESFVKFNADHLTVSHGSLVYILYYVHMKRFPACLSGIIKYAATVNC